MKTDDRKRAAFGKKAACGRKGALEFVQLAVDFDADCLKTARCGMLSRVALILGNAARNEFGKFARAGDGPLGAFAADRASDFARKALFAVVAQHARNFTLGRLGDPFGRREARARVHAHVQGPVHAEGKAALGLVDLRARDADVHENARHAFDTARGKLLFHVRKRSVHDFKARIVDFAGRFDGFGIAVKGNEARVRGDARKNGAAVPAASEGRVHEHARVRDGNGVGRFVEKNRAVQGLPCLCRCIEDRFGHRRTRPSELKIARCGVKACGGGLFFELGKTRGVPNLEMLSHTHERHVLVDAGKGPQIGGDQEAARFVERKVDGAAQNDALQETGRIGKRGQGGAFFFPAGTGIDEQAAVGVTGDRHFERARRGEGLAMTTRHRHSTLGIKRE